VALKKPSDIFGNKTEDNNIPVIESDNSLREELDKVESLSDQVTKLQQELSQKVVQTDLEKLVISQIHSMRENFEYLQNDFRNSNKKDIREFKGKVSELTEIVGNLVENELPKYKKQITTNEFRIGEKFQAFKGVVEENISGIREEIDTQVNNIAEVIDNNLEYFNNQLQETSDEVKRTSNTYNKLSKIVETRVSKENEKLEEYSQTIQSLYEAFLELETSIQEKTSKNLHTIEEKFDTISSDIKNKFDSISSDIKNKFNTIDEEVDNIRDEVSSEISSIKADVTIFEKHNKDTDKLIQEFSEQLNVFSELDENITKVNDDINELKTQSTETKKDLEIVERYIQNHHQDLIELREEVFSEIEQIPVGNLQENLERLEKKIDYIKETYSKIQPEIIVKEVIKEGLLNEPPETKNSDPLTPLDQKFVTLDQLQEHYRLFINRIQQQLSTLGGGGETKLKYLDDIVGIATNASAYDGKFLKYNHSIGKFVFDTAGGGGSGDYASVAGIATYAQGLTGTPNLNVGIVTAISFFGDGSGLTGIVATGTGVVVQSNGSNVGTALTLNFGNNLDVSFNSGIATISASGIATYASNAGIATYATSAGIATYATSAGIATYASNAGIATYATNAGIATYATNAGIATYASTSGIATYATNAGIATYATSAGIATYATNAGIATYATNAGIATYATNAGIATYASTAGIATYATNAGIATSVIGGIGSITQLQVTGISTFSNGPVFIGAATSTGTASQPLQVTGGAYVSGNLGIGTTNPTTTLQVNGTTQVQTSVGSTQSIWAYSLDYTDYDAQNVSLLVKPEKVYSVDASQTDYKIYEPVIFSHALTSANENYESYLYSLQNYTNVAGTAPNARFYAYGSYNGVIRNSTTDVSSDGYNQIYGFYNDIGQLGNVDQSAVTGYTYASYNSVNIIKATATNIYNTFNLTRVGPGVGFSASSTNAYGSYSIMQVGASQGTGIGTLTNYYGYYVAPTVEFTGQLTNYYGVYLDTPVVNGTLTNRYSIYSSDASSPMYHAGFIGIGTTNPTSKLQVVGNGLFSGIVTASSFSGNASSATYAATAGIATYATYSGIATYSTSAGIATVAQGLTGTPNLNVGIVTAISFFGDGSGLTGIVAKGTGVVVQSNGVNVGTALTLNFGNNLDVSFSSGIATINSASSGIATYASVAGIATYATYAGVSTSVIGGIGSVTQLTAGIGTIGIINGNTLDVLEGSNLNNASLSGITTLGFFSDQFYLTKSVKLKENTKYYTVHKQLFVGAGHSLTIGTGSTIVMDRFNNLDDVKADSLTINNNTLYGSSESTTNSTSKTPIHSGISTSIYRSVEYTIQATREDNFHTTKILALHNGTLAYKSEIGNVFNNSSLGTFDVDVLNDNMRLLVTPTSSIITNYKINYTAIKI